MTTLQERNLAKLERNVIHTNLAFSEEERNNNPGNEADRKFTRDFYRTFFFLQLFSTPSQAAVLNHACVLPRGDLGAIH